jgi:hypothetical protein
MKLEEQVCSPELAKRLKDIPGYKGLYAVGDDGSVLSLRRGKYLNVSVKKGYENVTLCKRGSLKTFLLHRLVAQAFVPAIPNKPDVNHKDGNKLNNYFWNLEWCNDSENQVHARKLGLQGGERSNTAKLTVKAVRSIRVLYATGKHKMKALGKRFGINEQTVSKIVNRHTWRYV